MGEFYVYVHLRADSGLPFYVGKGKGKRAYNYRARSEHWKRVARKHGVIVEIIRSGLTEDQADTLEIDEIAWFRGYYEIVNVTDGGEGKPLHAQVQAHKDEIVDIFKKHGGIPAEYPSVRKLRGRLSSYTSPSSEIFDPSFRDLLMPLGFCAVTPDTESKKEEIRRFYRENGRLPGSQSDYELKLRGWLSRYVGSSQSSFDPDFSAWVRAIRGDKVTAEERRNEIRAFFSVHGRLPHYAKEPSLYRFLKNYCSPTNATFDADFRSWAVSCGHATGRGRRKSTSP